MTRPSAVGRIRRLGSGRVGDSVPIEIPTRIPLNERLSSWPFPTSLSSPEVVVVASLTGVNRFVQDDVINQVIRQPNQFYVQTDVVLR